MPARAERGEREGRKRECPRRRKPEGDRRRNACAAEQIRAPQAQPAERRRTNEKRDSPKGGREKGGGNARSLKRGAEGTQEKGQEEGEREKTTKDKEAYVNGHPSRTVSGKVGVSVGVAGVSSAVAMESRMPAGMDSGDRAAARRSGCRGGVSFMAGVAVGSMTPCGMDPSGNAAGGRSGCRWRVSIVAALRSVSMLWPRVASAARAGKGVRRASAGTGGGGVGGRRVPGTEGIGMGMPIRGGFGAPHPPVGDWAVVEDAAPGSSTSGGRGGGGRLAAAGGEPHLPGPVAL